MGFLDSRGKAEGSKTKVSLGIYMRMQEKRVGNSQRGRRVLVLAVLTGALVFCKAGVHAAPAKPNSDSKEHANRTSSGPHDENAESELYRLTNEERAKAGLPPLEKDDRLAQAALEHAQVMVQHGQLAHQFSGEPSVRDRIASTNLHFDRSGENVAYDDNAGDANQGFMKSPPHRANILSPDYNSIGIAAVQKGDLLYVVEDFARQLPDYSTDKVEQIIGNELEQVRSQHSLPLLKRLADSGLREQTCQMAQQDRLITTGLRTARPSRYTVAYTATDPAKLPSDAIKPVTDPSMAGFAVGACYAKSESHPNALYWVALTFF
jgi:uncharacterized protein YkwD